MGVERGGYGAVRVLTKRMVSRAMRPCQYRLSVYADNRDMAMEMLRGLFRLSGPVGDLMILKEGPVSVTVKIVDDPASADISFCTVRPELGGAVDEQVGAIMAIDRHCVAIPLVPDADMYCEGERQAVKALYGGRLRDIKIIGLLESLKTEPFFAVGCRRLLDAFPLFIGQGSRGETYGRYDPEADSDICLLRLLVIESFFIPIIAQRPGALPDVP